MRVITYWLEWMTQDDDWQRSRVGILVCAAIWCWILPPLLLLVAPVILLTPYLSRRH